MGEDSGQKTIAEAIIDDLFHRIEACEEFDAQTIQELKRLAARRGLTSPVDITEAIAPGKAGEPG